jgi:hypothetical protein
MLCYIRRPWTKAFVTAPGEGATGLLRFRGALLLLVQDPPPHQMELLKS